MGLTQIKIFSPLKLDLINLIRSAIEKPWGNPLWVPLPILDAHEGRPTICNNP